MHLKQLVLYKECMLLKWSIAYVCTYIVMYVKYLIAHT